MTPKKQVSPAIRILRGERDASARATHLEAATRKFLVTTNERKQMSTKTNFKRIALVAVAALGLGVLSSVPSQATPTNASITAAVGTATTSLADSSTAGTVTLSYLATASTDTYVIGITNTSSPAGNTILPALRLSETTSARVDSGVGSGIFRGNDTITAAGVFDGLADVGPTVATAASVSAKFFVQLESAPTIAGTYTATVSAWNKTTGKDTISAVVTITVSAPSKLSSAATSTAVMSTGATFAATVNDSTVAAASTASTTAVATIRVTLLNAVSTQASESVTVTTTAGVVGASTQKGRSVLMAYPTSGQAYLDVNLWPDGTAGTASIVVSTASVTFAAKSVTFYSTTPTKITAASYSSVIGASGIGVHGSEFDALDNNFGAGIDVYAYSSDTAVISNYGTACTYNSTLKVALCTLAGLKNGTANITLRDASTVALSTVASNAVAVRVSLNAAASAKITFSKSSYAPGEKATALVTVYDSAGAVMPAGTYSNLFATGGITTTSNVTWSAGESLTAVAVTTSANPVAGSAAPVVSLDPVAQFTYFLPTTGGSVVYSSKGGSTLPTAGQVAITATAAITDSGAAALAAVTALATTVASLKTLITTLTNLVLKIQKKVKA
jgi:hypothetical protein